LETPSLPQAFCITPRSDYFVVVMSFHDVSLAPKESASANCKLIFSFLSPWIESDRKCIENIPNCLGNPDSLCRIVSNITELRSTISTRKHLKE
jgi:hypothetical protein